MSTRCNVTVRDGNGGCVYLYHHDDGYPSFMGPKLEAFVKAIADKGIHGDAKAFAAEMSRLSCVNHRIPREPDATDLTPEEVEYTQWRRGRPRFEFTDSIHGDVEYIWEVWAFEEPLISCEKVDIVTLKRTSIDYLVAWKKDIEEAIRYMEEKIVDCGRQSDSNGAREYGQRLLELKVDLAEIKERIQKRDRERR